MTADMIKPTRRNLEIVAGIAFLLIVLAIALPGNGARTRSPLGSGSAATEADSTRGSHDSTDAEQPFCGDRDNLIEFVRAMSKEDEAWMKAVPGCALVKAGLKQVVIESDGKSSPIGPIAKVRLFTPDGHSLVGYTFDFSGH